MTGRRPIDISVASRRVAWDALWDRLLQPPRPEPATPEHIPSPEEIADPEPRTRGEGTR